MQLTRTHRILIGVVVAGAVLIAAIGFAGSYSAVRDLAQQKGFGAFSVVFPIGIDAGIVVLLSLDLLLTWIRIPFPLLRQTAWLLTIATIAFNGAAAWPDPLGVGMHAIIPILFVVSVEAARHAIGRIADITADKHMEGVRLSRWLLAFPSTFRLWRRMKLWELRSYDQVIKLEQDRLVYRARLRARYGRAWRRKAPVEAMMPLKLARYGVPLAETAPDGLAAAGIEPALIPAPRAPERRELPRAESEPGPAREEGRPHPVEQQPEPVQVPTGNPGRHRPLGNPPAAPEPEPAPGPAPGGQDATAGSGRNGGPAAGFNGSHSGGPGTGSQADADADEPLSATGLPDDMSREEAYYGAFRRYVAERGDFPNARQFGLYLMDLYGVLGRTGGPLSERSLRGYLRDFRQRYSNEMDTEYIA